VRFTFGEIAEYMRVMADTAGPIALALRGLSEDEREATKAQVVEAFAPFAAEAGYELPGVSLTAATS